MGDPTPFNVSVDNSDISIHEFKVIIKEQSPLLASVYAMSLTLWKVRDF